MTEAFEAVLVEVGGLNRCRLTRGSLGPLMRRLVPNTSTEGLYVRV
jgi:hypothetical protein